MNKTWLFACLLTSAAVSAQNMDQADYIRQMEKAQACMAQIDQSALQDFEGKARAAESKIKALCAQGKRDQAQQEGMAFAREVNTQPELLKMRECMKLMQGMMPAMPYFGPEKGTADHVCDN
jgi:hypothetical protein